MQHFEEDIKILIEDLQIFNTNLKHKTRRAQVKKAKELEDGLKLDAPDRVGVHRTSLPESCFLGIWPAPNWVRVH
jgi:hypothetical protein